MITSLVIVLNYLTSKTGSKEANLAAFAFASSSNFFFSAASCSSFFLFHSGKLAVDSV
jgi:hypothetical protein